MGSTIFSGWEPIISTLIAGPLGYLGIILILRASGKRTLSKLNMFDFIVTVAFGSVLATMLLSSTTSVAQGLVAFATLVVLQFVFTWSASRFQWFDSVLKADPVLLYHRGQVFEKSLKKERVSRSELDSAVRDSSLGSIDDVAAMVLETDGTISVIPKAKAGNESSIPINGRI